MFWMNSKFLATVLPTQKFMFLKLLMASLTVNVQLRIQILDLLQLMIKVMMVAPHRSHAMLEKETVILIMIVCVI